MANPTYSVVYTDIAAEFFPQVANGFHAQSTPTSTTVTTIIAQAAAELNGVLAEIDITASGIDVSGEPQAFAWCQETVKLGAAYRVARALGSSDTPVAKAWEKSCNARLAALKANPGILADATQPTNPTMGLRSFTRALSLETPDSTEYTDNVVPTFRMDDEV